MGIEWDPRGGSRNTWIRSRPALWGCRSKGVTGIQLGWMGYCPKAPVMSTGAGGRQEPDQPEAKPRGPQWQETAEPIGDRMPRVLGRGWIEAAVSTLHCSSLDSVFLSPIYTLSVLCADCSSARGAELRLTFSPLTSDLFTSGSLPRPTLTSVPPQLNDSLSGSLGTDSQFTPSLGARGLG